MVIVGSDRILRKFKTIKEFRVDLGESFTKEENQGDASHPNMKSVFKVNDPFVKSYINLYGNYIYKYGKIGSLQIYTDHNMEDGFLSFFNGDDIRDFKFDNRNDFRSFISEKLNEMLNKELDTVEVEKEVEKPRIIESVIEKKLGTKLTNPLTDEKPVDTKKMSNDELIRYLLEKRQKESEME